jgi:hypothetical protein
MFSEFQYIKVLAMFKVIMAVNLGSFKCVVCLYRSTREAVFRTIDTDRIEFAIEYQKRMEKNLHRRVKRFGIRTEKARA